jgi:hypothetical protein
MSAWDLFLEGEADLEYGVVALLSLLSWPSPLEYDAKALQTLNSLGCSGFDAWEHDELNHFIKKGKKDAVGVCWFDFACKSTVNKSSVALVYVDLGNNIAVYDHPMEPTDIIPACVQPLQTYLCKISGKKHTEKDYSITALAT